MDYYAELLELPLVRRSPIPQNVYNFQKSQKLNSSTFKYIIFKNSYL